MHQGSYDQLETYVNTLQWGTDARKVWACKMLGQLGMGAEEARHVLWIVLHDPSSEVRHAAAAALTEIVQDIRVTNDDLAQRFDEAALERAQLPLFAAA